MILNKINEITLEKHDQCFNDGYDMGYCNGYGATDNNNNMEV